jgi:hypothetical protein
MSAKSPTLNLCHSGSEAKLRELPRKVPSHQEFDASCKTPHSQRAPPVPTRGVELLYNIGGLLEARSVARFVGVNVMPRSLGSPRR